MNLDLRKIPDWFRATSEGKKAIQQNIRQWNEARATEQVEMSTASTTRIAEVAKLQKPKERAIAEVDVRAKALRAAREELDRVLIAEREAYQTEEAVHRRCGIALRDPGDPVNEALCAMRERLMTRLEDERKTTVRTKERGEVTWGGRRVGPLYSNGPQILARMDLLAKALHRFEELQLTARSVEEVVAFEEQLLASLPAAEELVEVS